MITINLLGRAVLRAQAKAWYAVNKDKWREYRRRYYLANIERLRAEAKVKQARRRAQDPERIRAQSRSWYQRYPERAAAQQRRWRLANPERVRRNYMRRRAAMRANAGDATEEQIAARVAFFGGVCSYCGGPYEHLDHAIPVLKGGANWPANLRPACERCNLSKGAKTPMEFAAWRRRLTTS